MRAGSSASPGDVAVNARTATVYFRTLSESLLATQVTDGKGAALPLDEGAGRAVGLIQGVRTAGGTVMLIGNGGSASIASHLQNDLCKAAGVRALVFTEPPLLTALSNDFGYGCVFERPIELWARSGDLLLAISSSGRSENILRGVGASLGKGCQVITLSGFRADNPLRRMGHLNFYVASDVYGYVEVAHLALVHFLADGATGRPGGGGRV
jgi:D-sedoheptulose 7-phosphate isomerase